MISTSAGKPAMNLRLRARAGRHLGIALLALALVGTPLALTGCGGGGGQTRNAASRSAKGNVSFTVVWPERTRLIPNAANSIVVTLTRRSGGEVPDGVVKNALLTRPAPGQPLTTTATFSDIELGVYEIVASAYPGSTGGGVPNPVTGENVAVATNNNRVLRDTVEVLADQTVTRNVTMDTNIATLTPGLPAGFVRTPGSTRADAVSATPVTRIRPGQTIALNAAAFDATPPTATPPGPYRVILSPNTVQYVSSNPSVVSVNSTTGVATAQAVTAEATATITITDSESGAGGTLSITVTPVGLSTTAPWPKFHGTAANTGRQTAGSAKPSTGATAAELATGSRFQFSSPVVGADGTTYIGTFSREGSDNNQKLFALTSANAVKWTFAAGGDIDTAPVIAADGTVLFTTTNGIVWAVRDGGTGARVLWTTDLNALTGRTTPIAVSPTLDSNGTLYVATASPDNRLYAIDSLTGAFVTAVGANGTARPWSFQTLDQITNTPTLSFNQGRIYVADNSANVYAIQTGIGAPGPLYPNNALQAVQVALDQGAPPGSQEGIAASLVLSDPAQFPGVRATLWAATTGSNRLIALDPVTLAQLNKQNAPTEPFIIDTGGAVYSTPALSPNGQTLYYATQDYSSGIFDHKVAAITTADGNLVWRTPEPDLNGVPRFTEGFNASPLISQDGTQLYIAGYDGHLYGFDATVPGGGVDVARQPTVFNITTVTTGANPFLGSPAIRGDGSVIFAGDNGQVYFVK